MPFKQLRLTATAINIKTRTQQAILLLIRDITMKLRYYSIISKIAIFKW